MSRYAAPVPTPKHDILTLAGALRRFELKRVILAKPQWEACRLPVRLRWTTRRFGEAYANAIPDRQGVYSFIVEPRVGNHPNCHYLVYVGKTERQTLRVRYRQYLQDARSPVIKRPLVQSMLDLWEDHLLFCYAIVADRRHIATVEDELLKALLPPMNTVFPGRLGPAMRAFA